jgi:hypothetical protein
MTSHDSGSLQHDFFATEVRLFRADVDLTLRSGMWATSVPDMSLLDTEQLALEEIGDSPVISTGLVGEPIFPT